MEMQEALRRCFGHTAFRPGQRALVEALLSGRDVLGVMPTGAGKSICYQLPAVLLPGLTVVLSPLISLMKDQVTSLGQAGIPAAFLNSSLTAAQCRLVYERARAGAYRILYVAPERLEVPEFQQFAAETEISLVAVDEAHCVSQWGQDFRPSYRKIADFVEALPVRPPVGAFTATATEEVREDIIRLLRLRDPYCAATGFDRPNLRFSVVTPRDKTAWLLRFLAARPTESGIVYCATRKAVESVCAALHRGGFSAARYHAGLEDEERRRSQEDFEYDRVAVMVATNAFGMGIDKSNVSFVVHYNMPKNLESYYQEAGRAGRDGSPAECVLLFAEGDVQTARFLISNTEQDENLTEEERAELQRRDLGRLEQMVGYCRTGGCLRACLLRYFGEEAPERCGNCGNCLGEFAEEDVTEDAQKILSAVARITQKCPWGLGAATVAGVLAGSREQRILQSGLDTIPTYGALSRLPRTEIRARIDLLTAEGYLEKSLEQYPVLRLTPRAGEVLFHGKRVTQRVRQKKKESARAVPSGGGLFEALRALRAELAREEGVPAYLIFSNAALEDMAERRPRTEAEFLEVSGVGEKKAARYGSRFLRCISENA